MEKSSPEEGSQFRLSQYSKHGMSASAHNMRDIKSAVSKQEPTDQPINEEDGQKINWQEQKKLLRKRQVK